MSKTRIAGFIKGQIDDTAKAIYAKYAAKNLSEKDALAATLRDVGQIMFGTKGLAVDYLELFLKPGEDKAQSFTLNSLLKDNPTIKDRVNAEVSRRVLGVKTAYEKRSSLKDGVNWLGGLDPCITVFQKNYDDVQWWGALGTFQIKIAHPAHSVAHGTTTVTVYGEDIYKWAPEEGRTSQIIHRMADKLEKMGAASRFAITTPPMLIQLNAVDAMLARNTVTNRNAGRGLEGSGFNLDQVGRAIYVQYLK